MNWVLALTMLSVLAFGVVAIYSAVSFRDDPGMAGKWNSQIIWILLGMVVFVGASVIDYRWVKWGSVPMYLVGIVLLVLVQVLGGEVNSAKSWFVMGPIMFQPSQFAIAAGILLLAFILAELHKYHPTLRLNAIRILIAGIVVTVPFLFVLKEGDLGSASVWLPVLCAMLLVGSIPLRYLTAMILIGLMVVPIAYFFVLKPYQKSRVETYIKMLKGDKVDRLGDAYAAYNISRAVGSAGWHGKGFLGKRVHEQKTINRLGMIPKDTAHNDFIWAVLAEKHGFRGSVILMSALLFVLLQCIFVAFCSRDALGRLVVVGVVALLFAHIFQHIGMNILLLPITGIPLPFISYGGSFLIVTMFLMGMVQSVWIHRFKTNTENPIPPNVAMS